MEAVKDTHQLLETLHTHCLQAAGAGDGEMPDEIALADRVGVGRPKVREALARLEERGVLTRRRRVGIRVNPEVAAIGSRLDRQIDYEETLKSCGYKPAVRVMEVRLAALDEAGAEFFSLDVNTPCLITRKVWLADGRPAMTALDRVPAPGLDSLCGLDGRSSVFELVQRIRGLTVCWEITRPSAEILSEPLAAWLETPPESPAMSLRTIGVEAGGARVFDAVEHHVPGVVDYGIIRTVRS